MASSTLTKFREGFLWLREQLKPLLVVLLCMSQLIDAINVVREAAQAS